MSQDDNENSKKGFTVNDRRWWLDEDADLDKVAEAAQTSRPSYIEELEAQLEEKNKTLQEYIGAHKSSVSEMDEVRVRLEKELEKRVEIEKANLICPFIEVLDNLTRLDQACESGGNLKDIGDGMGLVLKQLQEQLKKIGIEPISVKGQRFDPNSMEALMTVEVGKDQDGLVIDEIRPGYKLGDKIVRPAGVRVGVGK